MSDFKNNPGTGNLFKHNPKEPNDKAPTMKGKLITPDGHEYEIAAWSKTDKNGNRFLSLKVSEPFKKDASPAPAKENPKTFTAANDDLPF